jgi:hypothetical protein
MPEPLVPSKFPPELNEVVDGLERKMADFRRGREKPDEKVATGEVKPAVSGAGKA